jgi:hypothetical protein
MIAISSLRAFLLSKANSFRVISIRNMTMLNASFSGLSAVMIC